MKKKAIKDVLVETAYQGATLDFLFELGIEVEDSVTGYKGHITARVQHITGCNTYHV
jgi:hypothetical protein